MVRTLAGRQRPLSAFEDADGNSDEFRQAERRVINTLCQVNGLPSRQYPTPTRLCYALMVVPT